MKTIKVVDSMGKNAKWSSKYLHVSFLISKSNSQYSFYFSFSIYFFFFPILYLYFVFLCFSQSFKLSLVMCTITPVDEVSQNGLFCSHHMLSQTANIVFFCLFVFVFSKMSVAVSHQNAHSPPQVFPSSTHEEPLPVWPRAFHISLAGILDAERKRE